jgi:hypothetical protein
MSVTWGSEERRSGYFVVGAWLLSAVVGGVAIYGVLLLGAWVLRSLGVHVTGI